MSRFSKIPVTIPENIKIEIKDGAVSVTGPKGTLTRAIPTDVALVQEDGKLKINTKGEGKFERAIRGTIKAHVNNMIKGVTDGWTKSLEIIGTGYRAEVKGNDLQLILGYSHPILIKAPDGIKFSVEKLKVTVEGMDKDVVGQVAAEIRASREPDVYQGKGVRYENEIIRKKPGKQAAKAA